MKKIILTHLLLAGLATGFAQQEYTYTFFGDNTSFFNPAATGSSEYASLTGAFRKQWVGFDGSPTSGGVTYELPLKKYNMGVGGMVYQDHVGVTNQTNIAALYSYQVKLNDNNRLAFGVNAGIDLVNTKYDRLTYWDADDEVFTAGYVNLAVPHIGIGAYYYTKNVYAGISVPRIMSVNADQFNSANFQDAPSLMTHYYLTAGFKTELNEDFSLKTALLMKYVKNVKPQADISLMALYKNMFGLGVSYKSLGFVSTFLQYNYKDAVVFGYAFDFSTNPLQGYSKGSHEILLQYRFGLDPFDLKGKASID